MLILTNFARYILKIWNISGSFSLRNSCIKYARNGFIGFKDHLPENNYSNSAWLYPMVPHEFSSGCLIDPENTSLIKQPRTPECTWRKHASEPWVGNILFFIFKGRNEHEKISFKDYCKYTDEVARILSYWITKELTGKQSILKLFVFGSSVSVWVQKAILLLGNKTTSLG